MAIMTDPQRFDAWAEFMRESSGTNEAIGVSKADLRAAIDAADQWASDNAASYNAALPLPARTALTAPQKARLLMRVIMKRWFLGT